jgi:hypothetical protein
MPPDETKTNLGPAGISNRNPHNAVSKPARTRRTASGRQLSRRERERAQTLARLCRAIQRRRDGGMSLRKALKWPSWYWRQDRRYRCDHSRRVQISRGSLTRFYYAWRRSGKSLDAFELGYKVKFRMPARGQVRAFIRSCSTSRSLQAAYRNFSGRGKSVPAWLLIRGIPRHAKRVIKAAQRRRRQHETALREIGRTVRRMEGRV